MSLAEIEIKYGNENYEETFDGPEVELNEDEIEEPIVPTEEFETDIRDAEDIDKATVAVESYLQILTQRENQGLALTEDVAKLIRVGLEAIDPNFFSNTVISVENVLEGELVDDDDVLTGYGAKEVNSSDPASKRTKSGLMEKLKKLMAAAFEALKRLFHSAMNLYHELTTNLDKLLSRIDEVAKRATVLEGGHKFKMRGLGRLSIDGKFAGDDPKQYENLAKLSGKHLYDITIGIYKEVFGGYKDLLEELNTEDGLRDFLSRSMEIEVNLFGKKSTIGADEDKARVKSVYRQMVAARVKTIKSLTSSLKVERDNSNVPGNILKTVSLSKEFVEEHKLSDKEQMVVPMKSETLLGNRAFYVGVPGNITNLGIVSVNMGIHVEPKKESSLGLIKEEITTIKARDAISILANLKGLVRSLTNYRSEFAKVSKEVNPIIRSGDALMMRLYRGTRINDDQEKLNILTSTIFEYNRTLRRLTQTNWNYIGYVLATTKAAVAMINQMVEIEDVEEGETVANKDALALPAPK